jgi:uncharacterized ubiquitin-like protein YukD
VINEKQARIVRRIYKDYLDGKGTNRIARELEEEGVPNWNGKAKWYESSIRTMLGNEKYKGDALLQKTYTVDFLTKKRVVNNGEIPQYYIEESHPAIIDKEMWEAVQLEMKRRRAFAKKYNISKLDYATVDNPFAGRVIWRCNRKYEVKGKKSCENKHIDDKVLYKAFINTFNAIIENKDYFMEKWKEVDGNCLRRYKARKFIKIFEGAEKIEKFDVDLFYKVIEKMIVYQGNRVIVTLLDGTEVECEIE